jgi:hypothetical protein
MRRTLIVWASFLAAVPAAADSFYTQCPDDPRAVRVAPGADGADGGAAIQAAIDAVQSSTR